MTAALKIKACCHGHQTPTLGLIFVLFLTKPQLLYINDRLKWCRLVVYACVSFWLSFAAARLCVDVGWAEGREKRSSVVRLRTRCLLKSGKRPPLALSSSPISLGSGSKTDTHILVTDGTLVGAQGSSYPPPHPTLSFRWFCVGVALYPFSPS